MNPAGIKGILMGIVGLILVVILCGTVLPDYLPVDGSLDFLPTIIQIAYGFGLAVYAFSALFSFGKKD